MDTKEFAIFHVEGNDYAQAREKVLRIIDEVPMYEWMRVYFAHPNHDLNNGKRSLHVRAEITSRFTEVEVLPDDVKWAVVRCHGEGCNRQLKYNRGGIKTNLSNMEHVICPLCHFSNLVGE